MPSGEKETSRRVRLAWGLVAIAALAFLVRMASEYGVAWDDTVQARYGELSLDYFTSGLQDRSFEGFWNMRYYGALFEMIAAGLGRLSPSRALEIRHVTIAVTALAAMIAATRFAALLELRFATLFAGIAVATCPVFYGHSFQNSKDIPFAACFAWSMVALVTWLGRDRPRRRDALCFGIALGLALAVRVGGVLLLPLVILGFGLRRWLGIGRGEGFAKVAVQAVASVGLAWGLMVATWPFAHGAPLSNPFDAFVLMRDFPVRIPVLFEGTYHASNVLPGRYLSQLLVLTTPPAILGLAFGGIAAAILGATGRGMSTRPPRAVLTSLLLVGWVVLPPLTFAVERPPVYDGLRHFLFVLPGIAVLAAAGAAHLIAMVQGEGARRLTIGLAALVLASPIVDLVRLHPYQMTYFNEFAGGVAGASGRYDTDYWATSYREAMEWIQDDVGAERRAVVLVAANEYSRDCAERYRGGNLEVDTIWAGGIDGALGGDLPAGVDYYVATTRVGLSHNFPDAPIVHEVGREDAVFTVIRGRERER